MMMIILAACNHLTKSKQRLIFGLHIKNHIFFSDQFKAVHNYMMVTNQKVDLFGGFSVFGQCWENDWQITPILSFF